MTLSQMLLTFEGLGFHFDVFGIKMHVSLGSIALAIFFAFVAKNYIARQMRERPGNGHLLAGIGTSLTIVGSLMFHEFAHGLVGALFGHQTTDAGLTGFGAYVRLDTPLNKTAPVTELLVGLSGPVANVLLVGLGLYLVSRLRESRYENAIQFFTLINYELAIFNMLPIMGLDGSKVLHGVLRSAVSEDIAAIGMLIATPVSIYLFMRMSQRRPGRFALMLEKL